MGLTKRISKTLGLSPKTARTTSDGGIPSIAATESTHGPKIHKSATYVQKIYRGRTARKGGGASVADLKLKDEKATLLQSFWRGKQAREEAKEFNSFVESPSGRALGQTEQGIKLRMKMASYLYPSLATSDRAKALDDLERSLLDAAPEYVAPKPKSEAAAEVKAVKQARADALREAAESASIEAEKAAILLQAQIRGLISRKSRDDLLASGMRPRRVSNHSGLEPLVLRRGS